MIPPEAWTYNKIFPEKLWFFEKDLCGKQTAQAFADKHSLVVHIVTLFNEWDQLRLNELDEYCRMTACRKVFFVFFNRRGIRKIPFSIYVRNTDDNGFWKNVDPGEIAELH